MCYFDLRYFYREFQRDFHRLNKNSFFEEAPVWEKISISKFSEVPGDIQFHN
jgi:hypothetical protein